jgi:sphinganine-1-phosphate aldolase
MSARIPAAGQGAAPLLEQLRDMGASDTDWRGGRAWSLVYHAGEAHSQFLKDAHNLYFSENALNPMAFRSLKQMETEIVQMTASMLHGPKDAVGNLTSGGTESILLAVMTARDRARAKRPWIRRPEMVLPRTAHVAFEKAAHLFGVRPRFVAIGSDHRADPKAMARAMSRRTILMVGSAPQYPHGVVDPIEELAAIALKKGVPFHVDACFGGFILPWLERLGHTLPGWDFRVPGVTSISADVHKYGYCPKGASVLLYRSMDMMRHQFFVSTDWPGGIYASPGLAGSRPGGPIAAAWASLMHLGEDGFMALAERSWSGAERLRDGIRGIPGLRVMGAPHSTIVTWTSDELDVYAVADRLEAVGWAVDRQQRPATVHCTVAPHHVPVIDQYLVDLRAAVAEVRANPDLGQSGEAPMYGMMARLPARRFVKKGVRDVMEKMYGPGGGVPDLTGGDDGPLMAAVHKHGPRVLDLIERIPGMGPV